MLAFHSNSSVPFFAKNHDSGNFKIDSFDLYNTVLSALLWRKYNGEIVMLTDEIIHSYYKKLGICGVWNDVKTIIPSDLEGINPIMFWAAGKLLALREMKTPVVMLDTDFIVWEKIEFNEGIIAAHTEAISPDIYPDFSYFNMKPGFSFHPEYNEKALPLNTAFLYIKNEDFKQFYVNKAIEFMKSAWNNVDYLCYMVFAEQRLLAICADYLKQPVSVLMNKDELFFPQNRFTHLWGAKQIMRESKEQEANFCMRCRKRIESDFPEFAYVIQAIEKEKITT